MISNRPNTIHNRCFGLLLPLILLVGMAGCRAARYENNRESREEYRQMPGPGALIGGGMIASHSTLGVKRGLNPETYPYKYFYRYSQSPKTIMDLLADILKHNGYPDIKKDRFAMTVVTGTKLHDSLFVKMSKGNIRTGIAARADRKKGKTVLALYICVEQKGRDGVWRVITIPSNQLDMIDSANYDTYFTTLKGYLKPKENI